MRNKHNMRSNRKFVDQTPGHLLTNKSVNSTELHYLGQLSRISKRIGKPKLQEEEI